MSQNTVRAGEYVLGVLSPDERIAVERDAATDPDLAAEIAFWNERFMPLVDAAQVEPPPQLFDRIRTAIQAQDVPRPASAPASLADTLTVRAAEGHWKRIARGVERKILWQAPGGRVTYLIRGEPGAHLAAHDHDEDEETYVIAGDLTIGTLTLGPGDYHLARRGHRHAAATTTTGCLLLITDAAA